MSTLRQYQQKRRWRLICRQRNRVEQFFRFLLENRTWRRHGAPFAKTEKGRRRRAERRFRTRQQLALFPEREHYEDGWHGMEDRDALR